MLNLFLNIISTSFVIDPNDRNRKVDVVLKHWTDYKNEKSQNIFKPMNDLAWWRQFDQANQIKPWQCAAHYCQK